MLRIRSVRSRADLIFRKAKFAAKSLLSRDEDDVHIPSESENLCSAEAKRKRLSLSLQDLQAPAQGPAPFEVHPSNLDSTRQNLEQEFGRKGGDLLTVCSEVPTPNESLGFEEDWNPHMEFEGPRAPPSLTSYNS